jgi:hypothetical protein
MYQTYVKIKFHISLSIYDSTAVVDLGRFISFLIYTQSVGLLGQGSAHRKAPTYSQNNTNTEKTHTDIQALSGIRTDDLSVRAGENGSCFGPLGHCDRLCKSLQIIFIIFLSIQHNSQQVQFAV